MDTERMIDIGRLILTQDNRATADPIFQVRDERQLHTPKIITQCFTEQGCKYFIEINGHHMKNPTIYVDSLWRNYEMIAIRKYLMNLATEARP
jgi:hypothetical protein